VREAVASLLEDSRKMRAHVQQRVEQMSQQDPEREAKALAGRVAELDKKLSRAQDLVTDGLISAHDLREKATAMRAERGYGGGCPRPVAGFLAALARPLVPL
jgi:hypothetical protein